MKESKNLVQDQKIFQAQTAQKQQQEEDKLHEELKKKDAILYLPSDKEEFILNLNIDKNQNNEANQDLTGNFNKTGAIEQANINTVLQTEYFVSSSYDTTIRLWNIEFMKKSDYIPMKIDIKQLPEEDLNKYIPQQGDKDVFDQQYWSQQDQVVPDRLQNNYSNVTCMVICENSQDPQQNFIVAGYASNEIIRYRPIFIRPQKKNWQKTVIIYKRLCDHLDSVTSIDYNGQGYIASTSTDMSVIIQDLEGTNNRQFFFNEMISKVKFDQTGDRVIIMAFTCQDDNIRYTHIYEWNVFTNEGKETIRKFNYPWMCDFNDICQIYPIVNGIYIINIGKTSYVSDLNSQPLYTDMKNLDQELQENFTKLQLMTERKMNFNQYSHLMIRLQIKDTKVLVTLNDIYYSKKVYQVKVPAQLQQGPIFPRFQEPLTNEQKELQIHSIQNTLFEHNFWLIKQDEKQIKKIIIRGYIDQEENIPQLDAAFSISQGTPFDPASVQKGKLVQNELEIIEELVKPTFNLGMQYKDSLFIGGELLSYVPIQQQQS